MLTTVQAEYGETTAPSALELPILGATPRDSLLLRKVEGLTPADVGLFIGDYAQDGGTYQGRRINDRNIVLTIELNPNPALGETVSGQRELLYKIFMDPLTDADFVKLNFTDENGRVLYAVGYTEKFEIDIFDTPDNIATISLICPDPYLRNNITRVLKTALGWTSVPVPYDGTAETGFMAEIYVAGTADQLVVDINGRTMVITGPFTSGQVIYINTIRGQRDIQLSTYSVLAAWYAVSGNEDRSPVDAWAALAEDHQTTPLIGNLSVLSRWLELHSQANTFKVYNSISTPPDGVFAVRKLVYTPAYWGM